MTDSHVLTAIRLAADLEALRVGLARIEACSVDMDRKLSKEAFDACPSCQAIAATLPPEMRPFQEEDVEPEHIWARGGR